MSERSISPGTSSQGTAQPPLSAGAQLQLAREDAGLTLDAVASQLKLAPRQVQAIENNDYALLPGRTFVRGFVRNYARLLQLDADAVVAALPGNSTPSLDSPALHATGATMSELPMLAQRGKSSWARWVIPLTLVAIIAAAALYERVQDSDRSLALQGETPVPPSTEPAAAPPSASVAAPSASPAATAGSAVNQSLPSPRAPKEGAAEPAPAGANATASSTPTAATAGATPPAPAPATAAPQKALAEASLWLIYHDKSWTTIRDAEGRVLVSKMIPGGQEQKLTGTPPFDLVIGNATEVTLAYKDEPVDLTPFIRLGVARLTLR